MICQTIFNENRWNKLQKSTIKFPNQVVYDEKRLDYSVAFFLFKSKTKKSDWMENLARKKESVRFHETASLSFRM